MIYPDTKGKLGEIRLNALERVWIQGKLRMWGRWSHISEGRYSGALNSILQSKLVTKSALKEAFQMLRQAGFSENEMRAALEELRAGRQVCSLAFCTDEEALKIERVFNETLHDAPALQDWVKARYFGREITSKRKLAARLGRNHPEWSDTTCRERIDVWLAFAEITLYRPMREAFGRGVDPSVR